MMASTRPVFHTPFRSHFPLDDNLRYHLVDFPDGYKLFTKYTTVNKRVARKEHVLLGELLRSNSSALSDLK